MYFLYVVVTVRNAIDKSIFWGQVIGPFLTNLGGRGVKKGGPPPGGGPKREKEGKKEKKTGR